MHIAHCLTNSGIGGGQQIVYTLVKVLCKNYPQLKITVILPANGVYVERFLTLGVNVVTFPVDKLSILSLLKIKNILYKLEIDVLHSHGKGAGFYSRLASRSAISAKRVHSYHGFHPPHDLLKHQLYYFLEKYLLTHTDQLVMVSNSEADEIESMFSFNPKRMTVLQNVIECHQGNNSTKLQDHSFELFLTKNSTAFKLCIIGRDDPVKNYPLAFQTIRYLLDEKKKNVSLIVIGLSKSNNELKEMLERYPNNIFAIEQTEDVNHVISSCNSLLITSKKEGYPLVVLEAMCCGKPVVGTNVNGIKDIITNGVNGLLCDQHAQSLANSICSLIDDVQLYQKLSAGALAYGSTMDASEWAEKYYQLYSRL